MGCLGQDPSTQHVTFQRSSLNPDSRCTSGSNFPDHDEKNHCKKTHNARNIPCIGTTQPRKMHAQEIYAIAVGSLFAIFLGWQVAIILDALRQRSTQTIRKMFLQTLVVTRRKGASDYTVASVLSILLLIAGNMAVLFVGVAGLDELSERLRAVFHINLIPLYLSARTPVLSEFMFA
jgi:hypothetical protein